MIISHTVRERMGLRRSSKLDEIVERSLKQAAIWDETIVRRLKKSALGMSGGQQQRLCIARAACGRTGSIAYG